MAKWESNPGLQNWEVIPLPSAFFSFPGIWSKHVAKWNLFSLGPHCIPSSSPGTGVGTIIFWLWHSLLCFLRPQWYQRTKEPSPPPSPVIHFLSEALVYMWSPWARCGGLLITFTGNGLDVLHTLSYLIFDIISYGKYYYHRCLSNKENEI